MSKTNWYDKNGNQLSNGDYVKITAYGKNTHFGVVNLDRSDYFICVNDSLFVSNRDIEKLANISDFKCADKNTPPNSVVFVDYPDETFTVHSVIDDLYCLIYNSDIGDAVVKSLKSCKLLTNLFVESNPIYVGDTIYSEILDKPVTVTSNGLYLDYFTATDGDGNTYTISTSSSFKLSAPKKKRTVYMNMYKIEGTETVTASYVTYATEEIALQHRRADSSHIGVAKFEF